ncbi:hypothetical protein LXL04_004697 [Taraxacum kok-saghyz]
MALILKWRWRFVVSDHMLWVRVTKSLYGAQEGFNQVRKSKAGDSPWERVIAAVNKLDLKGVLSKNTLRRQVGDGRSISFWLDTWVGDQSLASRFPRLAALERDIHCKVADRWSLEGWRWQWVRDINGGISYAHLAELMAILRNVSCVDKRDGWVWDIANDGSFSVAGTRYWIDERVLLVSNLETRWCVIAPRKVNIFIWRMLWKRLPTRVLLKAKGIDIPSVLCPVCGGEEERFNHLFFTCEVAEKVWCLVFRWLHLDWIDVREPRDMFQWVDGLRLPANKKMLVEVIICATFWYIWRLRNDIVHEARLIHKDSVFDSIRECSFTWASTRQKKVLVHWNNWLQIPMVE